MGIHAYNAHFFAIELNEEQMSRITPLLLNAIAKISGNPKPEINTDEPVSNALEYVDLSVLNPDANTPVGYTILAEDHVCAPDDAPTLLGFDLSETKGRSSPKTLVAKFNHVFREMLDQIGLPAEVKPKVYRFAYIG